MKIDKYGIKLEADEGLLKELCEYCEKAETYLTMESQKEKAKRARLISNVIFISLKEERAEGEA